MLTLDNLILAVVAAVGLVFVILVAKCCIFIVQEGTVIVVKRWGKHSRVLTAGLHWRMPFGDAVQATFKSQRQAIPLDLRGDSGGRLPVNLGVSVEVMSTIDPAVVRVLAYQVENPIQHLRVVAEAAVRELLIPLSYEAILADSDLAGKIEECLLEVAARLGYKILDVRIASIKPESSVQDAILAGERNQVTRQDEEAQARHDDELRVARATSVAAAAKIEAEANRNQMAELSMQLPAIIAELRSQNLGDDEASSIITALIYRELVMAVAANSNARIVLQPPAVDLSRVPDDMPV